MRRASRTDANHKEALGWFRDLGCSVHDTSQLGQGFPDICVGITAWFGPVTVAVEIKDSSKPPSARLLTPSQIDWHDGWLGAKAVVTCMDEALELVSGYKRRGP